MNLLASPLLTDLYELTMLHAYVGQGRAGTAVFEFFVRRLPPSRNFLMAAGLEQALDFLEGLRFSPEDLSWITDCGRFRPGFADYLERFRFTGDVHAMPEGTVFFADEPILRVTAPLPEAQLVETRLINLLQFQTMIASKAARCVLAAPGKSLVDFGLRRAHGAEAGLLAARASYLAGFSGTSAAAASPAFGIPVFGTMAHSFVQAFEDEGAAFVAYARANPGGATLLLDTYDTEAGAAKAVEAARRLARENIRVRGVRLDSGNLALHSRRVRGLLDAAGLRDVAIFASGDLDE
ncbi:MAG: nicotinate phosphoribosyltransferase, partial [Elusimicrobia bacterium]|nr:nicotinate phosphoribosyltransferase [Elusimicrobiota bacterium]